jgi:hypothetical protein
VSIVSFADFPEVPIINSKTTKSLDISKEINEGDGIIITVLSSERERTISQSAS